MRVMQSGETSIALWPPLRSRGADLAVWTAVALGMLAVALGVFAVFGAPGPGGLLLVLIAALLAIGAVVLLALGLAYRRLRYELGADGLRIPWLGGLVHVPFAGIEDVEPGTRLTEPVLAGQLSWPGIYAGSQRVRGIGRLRVYATSRDSTDLVLVRVRLGAIALAPSDPSAFRTALLERVKQARTSGASSANDPVWIAATTAPWTAARDRSMFWLLAAAAFLAGATTLAMLRYPFLPESLPRAFGSRPLSPDAWKQQLVALPLLAAGFVIVNAALGTWFHPRDRLLARVLWVSSAVVAGVVFVAVLRTV